LAKTSSLDTFRSLYKELRRKSTLKRIYYLYGDETFLLDLIQDEIGKLLPADLKDFNYDLIYGGESSAERVLSIARSYPMMSEYRVVIVKDFLKLDDSGGVNSLEEFISYFEQPNPAAILCLIDSKFPNKNTKVGKAFFKKRDYTGIYEFGKIHENSLAAWIIDWTQHSHQKQISEPAAQVLAQLVGQDLKLLSTEIDKLCTFVDSDTVIEIGHVKKITESYREYSVIELKEAVVSRNLEKSFMIAEQMLHRSNNDAGEIFKTLGFFYNVFGNIWQICRLREKGLNKQQVQQQLGISNNYFFNLQFQEASKFRLSEMPGIFEALLDTDRAVKGFSTLDVPSTFLLLIKRIVG
jgi:DNA polymerase-3 subunit delta